MTDLNKDIPFTKMQGAGNDFVVLDNRMLKLSEQEIAELAPRICRRKYGVGSDGILALSPSRNSEADYTMVYRNPDGSKAGMCGNGARCIALFAHSLGFGTTHRFNVHEQVYRAEITGRNSVSVQFPMESGAAEHTVDGQKIYQIHTGTEHIVIPVEEDTLRQEERLRERGNRLRHHEFFEPKGTNVNFICGQEEESLKLQTYERGVEDLTLACGTGAIASALIWHHLQGQSASDRTFEVETRGGRLKVHFSFDPEAQTYGNIKLEGPAKFVFKGEFLQR